MSRHIHLSLDVRGAIQGTGWKFVSSPDGNTVKKDVAVAWLLDRLAEGKRVLPLGECEGFNFETGCPGHEEADCAGCPHSPHIGPCLRRNGGTAHQCPCNLDTVNDPAGPSGSGRGK